MKQHYEQYTAEDRLVWHTLFERQQANLKQRGSEAFFRAVSDVKFSSEKIPDFRELDQILNKLTGWTLEVVPSIIPQKDFFELLAEKKFPATTWLRTMAQLDYLEEPDMFHDVFGHVPLLSNAAYTSFFTGIAQLALKHINEPYAIELLGRIYWFTIEFGLILEAGNLKIYGAGIISSAGETVHCLSNSVKHLPYSVRTIMETGFRTDIFQDTYFVIDSFESLYASLPDIENCLEEALERNKPQQLKA
jgi:phenylalanine-4-hydroxylase